MLMGQGRGVMEERQIGSGCDDIYFHGWHGYKWGFNQELFYIRKRVGSRLTMKEHFKCITVRGLGEWHGVFTVLKPVS